MRALANVDDGVVKAEIEIAASPERVFRCPYGPGRAGRVVGRLHDVPYVRLAGGPSRRRQMEYARPW